VESANIQPSEAQTTSPQGNKKNLLLFIPLIIICSILIVELLIVYKRFIVQPKQQVSLTPAPSLVVQKDNVAILRPEYSSVPDDDWKTYEDDKVGLKFRYPQNWYAKPWPGATFNVLLEDHDFEFPSQSEIFTSIQIGLDETINPETNEKFKTFKTLNEVMKAEEPFYDKQSLKVNYFEMEGKKAVQISGVVNSGMKSGSYSSVTYVQLDDQILFIALDNKEYEDIYKQIISTLDLRNWKSKICVGENQTYDERSEENCCSELVPVPMGNPFERVCLPSKIDGREVIY